MDLDPPPGWQPISRVWNYLNWRIPHALSYFSLALRFSRYEKTLLHPSHSFALRPSYLLYVDPVTHFIPAFHSLSIQAHTPSALATLSTSESSSLSPTHLCSKSHLLSILRFQDDCIASYPHSTAPIHRRTSLIVVDISRYPRIIDPRYQATSLSLALYLNPQTTT
jgi:hypothetical protein